MQSQAVQTATGGAPAVSHRLHYLDALRVLAVFLVFLYHCSMFFTLGEPEIRNPEQSLVATVIFSAFLAPWGMPFFFLLSGAAAWFALQRRTARQYAGERFRRLLVPFIVGSLLFTPLQTSLEWLYRSRVGTYQGSLPAFFFQERFSGWNPTIFGWLGHHLWFLGYLFVFALLLLPLFEWLKGERGRRVVTWLARLSEHRGGILLVALPLVIIQLGLRPFFPEERHWADFLYYAVFFLAGYLIYAHERFLPIIRRDRWLALGVAIASLLGLLATVALGEAETLFSDPANPGFYFLWTCAAIDAWCWSLVMLIVGQRFMNISNRWTRYGQEAVVPFYVFHQPVIFVFAFFVVQWQTGVTIKMLTIMLASFFVTLGLYELVRRVAPLRALFGMKAAPQPRPAAEAVVGGR